MVRWGDHRPLTLLVAHRYMQEVSVSGYVWQTARQFILGGFIMATIVANIVSIDRVGASRNGNPTYRLTADDGRNWLTQTDGSIGYEADNYRPRRAVVQRLALTLNGRGRVTGIEFTTAAPGTY